MPEPSTPVSTFEEIYQNNSDPWAYSWRGAIKAAWATKLYERRKYFRTNQIIPSQKYDNILEIGCSIGVFTKFLARRGNRVLAIDYSPTALKHARARCRRLPQVHFLNASVPDQFPSGAFDLIVFSEVAYYLSETDFISTARSILSQLTPGGYLVMVHHRNLPDLPLSGDYAHDWFLKDPEAQSVIRHLKDAGKPAAYRLDLFQKYSSAV